MGFHADLSAAGGYGRSAPLALTTSQRVAQYAVCCPTVQEAGQRLSEDSTRVVRDRRAPPVAPPDIVAR